MISKILSGFFKIIIKLVNVFLKPIDLLVASALPGVSNMFTWINNAFDTCTQFFGWIIDATMINTEVLSFIILVITFRLTIPLAVYAIKLVVKWYRMLMP